MGWNLSLCALPHPHAIFISHRGDESCANYGYRISMFVCSSSDGRSPTQHSDTLFMWRWSKNQELFRNFKFIVIFDFPLILMVSWKDR
jgi:hypothetical protein